MNGLVFIRILTVEVNRSLAPSFNLGLLDSCEQFGLLSIRSEHRTSSEKVEAHIVNLLGLRARLLGRFTIPRNNMGSVLDGSRDAMDFFGGLFLRHCCTGCCGYLRRGEC